MKTEEQLIEAARENKFKIDWKDFSVTAPNNLGVTVLEDFSLEVLKEFIDWTPFFSAWEMKGKYPAILTDAKSGVEATKLFNDANCNPPGSADECQCYSNYTTFFNSQQWPNCCPTNVLRNSTGACCAVDDLVISGKCVITLITGPCGKGQIQLDFREECDMANRV